MSTEMSTEGTWAALFSIAILAERLSWRIGLGGAPKLAAMIIVAPEPAAEGRRATSRRGPGLTV